MTQQTFSLNPLTPIPENIVVLQQLSSLTFIQSFAVYNTPEDMLDYLTTSLSYKNLETECAHSESTFFLAYLNNVMVGYLKINIKPIDEKPIHKNGLEVERIYVLQNYQGNSIGQFMMDFIYQFAIDKKLSYVWLGVWEKNIRAIKFYTRNGFNIVGSHDFLLGKDIQTDLLMQKELKT